MFASLIIFAPFERKKIAENLALLPVCSIFALLFVDSIF